MLPRNLGEVRTVCQPSPPSSLEKQERRTKSERRRLPISRGREAKLSGCSKLKREHNSPALHANRRTVVVSRLALGSDANSLFMSRRLFESEKGARLVGIIKFILL